MPHIAPLRPGDPPRAGRYQLTGRVATASTTAGAEPDIPPTFVASAGGRDTVMVALLRRERATGAAARDRFTAEARSARRVVPFCAARVLDAGFLGHQPYLVTEYVPGPSLAEVVGREGPLPPGPLAALAIGAATGLAAIHQAGLVHGSFGPHHVTLSPDGPVITGFGVTPPYGAATPAADLLAWARTVCFAAGLPAPPGDDLDRIPPGLASVVASCFTADPAGRPAARAALAALLGGGAGAGLLAEGHRRARAAAWGGARAPARAGRPEAAAGIHHGAGSRGGPGPATGRPPPEAARGHAGKQARAGRPPSRSRALWAAAAGAGALAVVAAGLLLAGRPASPSHAATVPAALAGTWAGTVHQTHPVLATQVRISLTAGSATGSVAYPALRCSGRLGLISAGRNTLTLRQAISVGRATCNDGVITLAPAPGGALTFTFSRPGSASPRGTLTRLQPAR